MKEVIGLLVVVSCGVLYAASSNCVTEFNQDAKCSCTDHWKAAQSSHSLTPPVCDKDGTYSAMQPFTHPRAPPSAKCVSKTGKIIIIGVAVTACKCPRERFETEEQTLPGAMGGYIPQCNDTTGQYNPRQFHGGAGLVWCVDQTGKTIGEKTRGTPVGC